MLACTPRSLVVRTLISLAACAGGASVLAEQAPQTATQAVQATVSGNPYLAAAIATGLAAIGAGIAVGIAGAAAIGAIAEKPELLGRSLIYVGLAEGIVIYGLIISFIILGAG
ncbi:MAG: ATP synthase subunit C [Deinococcales bacterium]|jgi:V/A-type H+-transporting ATPase subunit K